MPTRPLSTSYADELKLFPDRWQQVGLVLWIVILGSFPFLANANWLTIANLTLVTVVGATALMILTGFTGQISMGHAAFLAIGAYTAAVGGTQYGLPFWLILPLAGVMAAVVGLAIGPFALRLEGLYLAIVTVGLLFLVNHVLLSFPEITGGVKGMTVPVHPWFAPAGGASTMAYRSEWFGLTIGFEQKLYGMFLLVAVLTLFAAKNLMRTRTGRAMAAVRDHDLAAAVMGIDPAATKIVAFGLSSFFAGVAGAMLGFQLQYITVEPPFNLLMSVQYIAIIVLGGMGTVFGAVAGAIAFVMLSPVLEGIARHLPLLDRLSSAQQSTLLFAVIVMTFLIFEPLGLFGIWMRIKRYFMAWPFRY